MARLVDLSHPIEHGMVTYPGLPGPVISDFLGREASRGHYAEGTTFHIARLRMVGNTGTYLDAPFHRFAHGKDVGRAAARAPGRPRGRRRRRDRRRDAALDAELFARARPRGQGGPGADGLGRALAHAAVRGGPPVPDARRRRVPRRTRGPALVGIDSLNIDDTADGVRPAHTLLLAAGIPIVEHLCNLAALPESGFRLHCVPAPFRGLGSFPVRAYAVVAEA